MQGIYEIRNKVSGKRYIGSSVDVEKRWIVHKCCLGAGKHHSMHLQNSWNKYGGESFEFRLIEEVKDKEDLHPIEQEYLDEGLETGLLYNMARKATGGRESGWHHTKESMAKRRMNMPDQSGKNNSMYGRSHTEESKAKMRRNRPNQSGPNSPMYGKPGWNRGQPRSEECKQKLRQSWTLERRKAKSRKMSGENNPFYGRRHTKETIAKIEKSWTPERREKESARVSGENNPMYGRTGKDSPRYGKRNTEEARARISEANGRPYPAFHNVKTGQFLCAGKNLKKLCREQGLRYRAMVELKNGNVQESCIGWRVATNTE